MFLDLLLLFSLLVASLVFRFFFSLYFLQNDRNRCLILGFPVHFHQNHPLRCRNPLLSCFCFYFLPFSLLFLLLSPLFSLFSLFLPPFLNFPLHSCHFRCFLGLRPLLDRKSTRLNSSHSQ